MEPRVHRTAAVARNRTGFCGERSLIHNQEVELGFTATLPVLARGWPVAPSPRQRTTPSTCRTSSHAPSRSCTTAGTRQSPQHARPERADKTRIRPRRRSHTGSPSCGRSNPAVLTGLRFVVRPQRGSIVQSPVSLLVQALDPPGSRLHRRTRTHGVIPSPRTACIVHAPTETPAVAAPLAPHRQAHRPDPHQRDPMSLEDLRVDPTATQYRRQLPRQKSRRTPVRTDRHPLSPSSRHSAGQQSRHDAFAHLREAGLPTPVGQ
ncbi:hypothetical protein SAMN05421869_12692 [Nonomuraea jiangxiensis]|uniref:Uncharacterized protein n=1 Tax=Nonomuraea jiangxiensis TaxID=633440 RepID=A0A1G9KE66_9ACTN|nr:hypothetical protein SAMN05421869_12692 [Nonomuraea jiangxiensis]